MFPSHYHLLYFLFPIHSLPVCTLFLSFSPSIFASLYLFLSHSLTLFLSLYLSLPLYLSLILSLCVCLSIFLSLSICLSVSFSLCLYLSLTPFFSSSLTLTLSLFPDVTYYRRKGVASGCCSYHFEDRTVGTIAAVIQGKRETVYGKGQSHLLIVIILEEERSSM